MTRTQDLIDGLVADLRPVRRLPAPAARVARWTACAMALLATSVLMLGLRPDLEERLADPIFAIALAAQVVCAVAAAAAALVGGLPDRSRGWLLLPLPALAIWGATIGYGCLSAWVGVGQDGFPVGGALACLTLITAVGIPLATVTVLMLRHAAQVRSMPVAMAGGLAVAGVCTATLSITHQLDSSVMILLTNLGVAAALSGIGAALGGRLSSPHASQQRESGG